MSTEHLQTENPILSYEDWKAEVIRITKEETGVEDVKLNDEGAREWYNDGFSPYVTFRENFQFNY